MLFHKISVPTQNLLNTFSHTEGFEHAEPVNCILPDKCDFTDVKTASLVEVYSVLKRGQCEKDGMSLYSINQPSDPY